MCTHQLQPCRLQSPPVSPDVSQANETGFAVVGLFVGEEVGDLRVLIPIALDFAGYGIPVNKILTGSPR